MNSYVKKYFLLNKRKYPPSLISESKHYFLWISTISLIEADHLQGYLLNLAKQYQLNAPLLYASYQNHKVYKEMIQ